MGRKRTVPDAQIFASIRAALATGGDKAVSFSTIAQATKLAAPTLAQRYGTRDAMVRAALADAWDLLDAATEAAAADAPMTPKGAIQILKALSETEAARPDLRAGDFRDPALRERAEQWRNSVEAALSVRLGGGNKGREAAALLFAVWQGQALWQAAGGREFRLKDAVKRLV